MGRKERGGEEWVGKRGRRGVGRKERGGEERGGGEWVGKRGEERGG